MRSETFWSSAPNDLSRTVPAVVPSLDHTVLVSSKKTLLPAEAKRCGGTFDPLGLEITWTCDVPCGVPSLFQIALLTVPLNLLSRTRNHTVPSSGVRYSS